MMTCREVSQVIASDGLVDAPLRRRLAVRMHLAMCRHCRRYARQIRAIGNGARHLFGRGDEASDATDRLRASILGRSGPNDPPS